MRVLVIGGFLGSGKTTLLLSIAKKLTSVPCTVAIIENEIGEIGIDGKYISQYGMEVQELYGGCICCSLNTSLRTALEKIGRELKPDWVLLEPTGAAIPNDIIKTVAAYTDIVESYYTFILIDPLRYDMLLEMMTPLLEAQIESADSILINKIDEIEKDTLDSVIKSISSRLKKDIPVVNISAEKETNLESLLELIL
jgi:G3E family GTPase